MNLDQTCDKMDTADRTQNQFASALGSRQIKVRMVWAAMLTISCVPATSSPQRTASIADDGATDGSPRSKLDTMKTESSKAPPPGLAPIAADSYFRTCVPLELSDERASFAATEPVVVHCGRRFDVDTGAYLGRVSPADWLAVLDSEWGLIESRGGGLALARLSDGTVHRAAAAGAIRAASVSPDGQYVATLETNANEAPEQWLRIRQVPDLSLYAEHKVAAEEPRSVELLFTSKLKVAGVLGLSTGVAAFRFDGASRTLSFVPFPDGVRSARVDPSGQRFVLEYSDRFSVVSGVPPQGPHWFVPAPSSDRPELLAVGPDASFFVTLDRRGLSAWCDRAPASAGSGDCSRVGRRSHDAGARPFALLPDHVAFDSTRTRVAVTVRDGVLVGPATGVASRSPASRTPATRPPPRGFRPLHPGDNAALPGDRRAFEYSEEEGIGAYWIRERLDPDAFERLGPGIPDENWVGAVVEYFASRASLAVARSLARRARLHHNHDGRRDLTFLIGASSPADCTDHVRYVHVVETQAGLVHEDLLVPVGLPQQALRSLLSRLPAYTAADWTNETHRDLEEQQLLRSCP